MKIKAGDRKYGITETQSSFGDFARGENYVNNI
jgi:hypothetical protein